jgi:hypothetical protein
MTPTTGNEQDDVSIFYSPKDNGPFAHQSNAVGSIQEFGYDDLKDAECVDDEERRF